MFQVIVLQVMETITVFGGVMPTYNFISYVFK